MKNNRKATVAWLTGATVLVLAGWLSIHENANEPEPRQTGCHCYDAGNAIHCAMVLPPGQSHTSSAVYK